MKDLPQSRNIEHCADDDTSPVGVKRGVPEDFGMMMRTAGSDRIPQSYRDRLER